MLNKIFFINLLIIPILILAQVFVFNNIYFFQEYNPIIYIFWILFYPFSKSEKYWFLFFAFILGLGIDFFMNTGGINAFSSLLIAYIRNPIIRNISDLSKDIKIFKFTELNIFQLTTYLLIIIFIHHLLMFTLESFKLSNFFVIFKDTIFTSIFSFLFIIIIYSFIKNRLGE